VNVTIEVPDGLRYQLVYRLERAEPVPIDRPPGAEFVLLRGPRDAVAAARLLTARFGYAGAAKAAAKLATPSRQLYLVVADGRLVSYGWATFGQCRYYKVEPSAVVIGPIWTDESARGRGLATFGMNAALNAWVDQGVRLFYIDTECVNHPAQRVFQKCGFGTPLAVYIR
jgi:GNAT superfamily N-acetyltransferase